LPKIWDNKLNRVARNESDFQQITRYNSKTVKVRRIVSIKVDYEVVCVLSNGDIADDLE